MTVMTFRQGNRDYEFQLLALHGMWENPLCQPPQYSGKALYIRLSEKNP